MHIRSSHCSALLAAFAVAGLLAGCGAHDHEAAAPSNAPAPSEAAAPSDGELDAKAKAAINEANADAEFEKLKQEIDGGG